MKPLSAHWHYWQTERDILVLKYPIQSNKASPSFSGCSCRATNCPNITAKQCCEPVSCSITQTGAYTECRSPGDTSASTGDSAGFKGSYCGTSWSKHWKQAGSAATATTATTATAAAAEDCGATARASSSTGCECAWSFIPELRISVLPMLLNEEWTLTTPLFRTTSLHPSSSYTFCDWPTVLLVYCYFFLAAVFFWKVRNHSLWTQHHTQKVWIFQQHYWGKFVSCVVYISWRGCSVMCLEIESLLTWKAKLLSSPSVYLWCRDKYTISHFLLFLCNILC